MMAENYREAYEYVNKALEINPGNSELWENKAICSYWLSTSREIVEKQARETLTYLRTAQNYNPNSSTLPITSEMIAWNMFLVSGLWLCLTQPDLPNNRFSLELCREILIYVGLWEVCYEIHADTFFLKEAVKALSGVGKLGFPRIERHLPTATKREVLIGRIRSHESGYRPPPVGFFDKWPGAAVGSAGS
jgi:tetratricopeptide (TPR) repeat protein